MRMTVRAGALVLGSMAVAFAACDRRVSAPKGPEAVYFDFARALRTHEPKAAYGLLSKTSRDAIEARAKLIAAAAPGMVHEDPMVMVLQSGVLPKDIGEIKVLSQNEHSAIVEVGAPDARSQVKLVRESSASVATPEQQGQQGQQGQEGARWAVDVSEAFANK